MPRAEAPYDGFADSFAREASDSPYNAHYDRPTILELLGDVKGQRILDAGCGPGLYITELTNRGAHVVGIDQSADMVRHARTRLGPHIELRQHDLNEPLTWAADSCFDAVLLALVLHYVDDRVRTLSELARVLRPDGRVIISTSHPTADWLADGGSYFDSRRAEEIWSNGMTHRYWRQPLQAWVTEFTEAGFAIDRLVEHRPAASMRHQHPAAYEKLSLQPGFIAFQLIQPPARSLA
ncbi:class I SAM-dependent methyltransferase [Streptomyces sp. NPDC093225]|uniref:class I SAM-dependent methyltransferase n=1 Tax=Streptomyces sp. NPDC093225 TaxID=3366034 RepID=UPI0037F35B2C